jgi:hypothetical protein
MKRASAARLLAGRLPAARAGTGTGWPDVIVAALMATLALQGAVIVVRHSLAELRLRPVAA